jgi:DNA-binding response OmpR family regulator
LKIIAVSGTGLDDLERARQLGAALTLMKPFRLTQLLAAVRQLVGEQPPLVNPNATLPIHADRHVADEPLAG